MLTEIKQIMGITNNEFDPIILNYIESAKQDLTMVGIVESKIESTDSLIRSAINSYVLSQLDVDKAEMWSNSYMLQKDALRHYSEYITEKEV